MGDSSKLEKKSCKSLLKELVVARNSFEWYMEKLQSSDPPGMSMYEFFENLEQVEQHYIDVFEKAKQAIR